MKKDIGFRDSTVNRSQGHLRLWPAVVILVLFLAVGLFAGSTQAATTSGAGGGQAAEMQIGITAVATPVATLILTATPVPVQVSDLGDAPDSTNHFGVAMTAYPGVTALFPTVFDATTGLPVGPRHQNNWPLRYHLGPSITNEREADIGPDADGINNIVPPTNNKNNDGADDGLTLPVSLPHCQTTTLTYSVTVLASGTTTAYFNAWLDYNRNGAWGDLLSCPGVVSEWAVANQVVTFPGPGTYVITTPAFTSFNNTPSKGMWVRISLAESPAPAADGQGIATGYAFGETEDYKLPGIVPTIVATAVSTPFEWDPPIGD